MPLSSIEISLYLHELSRCRASEPKTHDVRSLMDILRILKALADPIRLRILALVSAEELSVGEVQEIVGSVQSSVSRHLAILREAGLVRDRKEGTNVYFAARDDLGTDEQALLNSLTPSLASLSEAEQDQLRLTQCRQRRAARSRDYFEAIAGDWESIRKSYFDDRVTSVAIEKLLPSGLSLADVGCGTGSLTFELARFSRKVVGFDLSRAMLRRARRGAEERNLTNVDFEYGDATRLPVKANAFDGVFCVMVLHFLDTPERAITELCRVTRPGGTVIVVDLVPHEETWMREEMAHRHLGFTSECVQEWMLDAGAHEVEHELTGAYAGRSMNRNGKRPVEIFVARGRIPQTRSARAQKGQLV
jgi:ubiquinone/menaquinone biosynthesis C-methylase UbiE/DNA-binding transcriptional ArsR family regulator